MVSDLTGRIFDIKRYAIHDGPGIRTTVFFKGCPLACQWCHNPEGLKCAPRVIYDIKRCIACQECVAACPQEALAMSENGVVTDSDSCRGCGRCVEQCPAAARELSERSVSVDQLMAVIQKDVIFYDSSGGGVTFSGGEPLLQAPFLMALLDECGRHGIHRAVDTAGYVDQKTLSAVARRTDLFLFDVKLIDSQRHRRFTGVPSQPILDNLILLHELGVPISMRIPVIPGINDDPRNLEQMCALLNRLPNIRDVHLLPYHDFQKNKYAKLGMPYPAGNLAAPDPSKLKAMMQRFAEMGFPTCLGG